MGNKCKACKYENVGPLHQPCSSCNGDYYVNFECKEQLTDIDIVNHPSHYTNSKIECIEAIEEITKPLEKFESYLTGTILKYLWRWKLKNGVEDLKKARWYLDKLIEKLEGESN